MKRVLAAIAAAVAVTVAVALTTGAGNEPKSTVRIDAIFDNVAFLEKGQTVRVAGAIAGTVEGLTVTRDHKARVEMSVDEKFAPFRDDADCTIQPQSLIGERFVQCTPGTPDGKVLAAKGDAAPTVPIERTHAPVDVDMVLGTFDRPARERLGILLGSLGAGLAGRGEDLDATIRRANPALQETRKVLQILAEDRATLQQLVTDSDTVLASLAQRRDRVTDFVAQAGTVAETAASRRDRLATAVNRLPPFLDAAQPALERLAQFAREGTPLAEDLNRAAPDLERVVDRTGKLATQLRPTLNALRPVVRDTRAALPDITPQVKRLQRFAQDALPTGKLIAELVSNMKERGALGGIGPFFYYGSAALARFDRYSHILPAYTINSSCALWTEVHSPACSAFYPSNSSLRTAKQRSTKRTPTRERDTAPARKPAAVEKPQAAKPESAPKPARPRLPETGIPLVDEITGSLQDTLDQALGPVQDLLDGKPLDDLLGGGKKPQGQPLQDLLDQLLAP